MGGNTAVFEVSLGVSEVIGSVGIVEWSLNRDNLERAHIEFGLDPGYGMQAPVDLNAPGYRTLLLGMKPSRTYHFRIVATDTNGTTYVSDEYLLETGPIRNGLPPIDVDIPLPNQVSPGYLFGCFWDDQVVYILDADGDYVWWHKTDIQFCSRAMMTSDGKSVVIGTNKSAEIEQAGRLEIVSFDGYEVRTVEMPEIHHDITMLPDGTIAYIEFEHRGKATCDRIMELSPDGTVKEVYSLWTDFEHRAKAWEFCHTNAIDYVIEEDAYYVSVLKFDAI